MKHKILLLVGLVAAALCMVLALGKPDRSPSAGAISPASGEAQVGSTGSEILAPAAPAPSAPIAGSTREEQAPNQIPGALAHFNSWAERYLGAATRTPELVQEGSRLAKERRTALRELIRRDPRQAIALAVPYSLRTQLPAEVQGFLEESVSAKADLNVIFARPPVGQEATCSEPVIRTAQIGERFYYAYTYGKRLRQFSERNTSLIGIAVDDQLALLDRPYRILEPDEAAAPITQARVSDQRTCPACNQAVEASGATVVDGGGVLFAVHSPDEVPAVFTTPDGQVIWAAGGSGGSTNNSPITPPTVSQGDKYFLYMRVRFADDEPAYEPSSDATTKSVLDVTMQRFKDMSYGTLLGRYAFTPTMTLPKPRSGYMNGWSSVDGMGALMDDAKATAASIATDPAFPGIPYPYHPTNYTVYAARWSGEPGGCCSYGGGGNAWIRWDDGGSVMVHEWGHAIGEPHANWWNPTTDDPIGPGSHEEYGNKFDNMGSGGTYGDYSAKHKALVNWLPAANYWAPTTGGVYRIFAHDQPTLMSTNKYGIRIFRPTRSEHQMWVEHRAYTVSGANAVYWTNGVMLSRELDWELLDMTPGSTKGKDDCTLTIGRTWSDAAAGVHYTALSRGNTPQPWVDVAVYFDSGTNLPPVAAVRANLYEIGVNTTISLTASAVDPNGDTLAYFWDFGDGNQSYNNLPNQTRSWSTAGYYVVRCVVSDMRGGAYSKSILIKVGTPATFQITGTVLDVEGKPLANVQVQDASGKVAVSDTDGGFVMGNLAAGTYSLKARRNGHDFSPAARTLSVGPNAFGANFTSISRPGSGQGAIEQYWFSINGSAVADLTNNARFPNSPDGSYRVADAFEIPEDWRETYGTRVRAYFIPPLSGGYRFYIASDDGSELYLSPTTNAAQKVRIAYVSGYVGSRNWTGQANQKSALLQLSARQPYYLEALQKEGGGGDHLSVGIEMPDGTLERPIAWHRLTPITVPVAPATLVTIVATDASASESGDAAVFTLTRSGDTAAALDAYVHASGSALFGTDYSAFALKQTIPAGAASVQFLITPVNDAIAETAESATVIVSPGPGYAPGVNDRAAILIQDNDGAPTVSVVASSPNASKTGPVPGKFTVYRTGSAASALTANVSVGGTAASGVDYVNLSNTVAFPAGQASVEVTVQPLTGNGIEPPKTVILTALAGTGYAVAAPSTATVTITQPGPGFGILREQFNDIGSAGTVAGLTNNANFPASPASRQYQREFFEGPVDTADSYGSRFRGWYIAPMTGNYYFYIASDDGGELWLGTNAFPESKRRVAYVSGWTSYRNWTAQGNQRSAAIGLRGGATVLH